MSIHIDNHCGIPQEEVQAYIQRVEKLVSEGALPQDVCRMELQPKPDGEIEIRYYRPCDRGMDRIRRITGYLSPLVQWNNAKKAEYRDRVKHGLTVV